MNNIKLINDFWKYMNACKWEQAKNLLENDFVAEWPQSRIRFKGSQNFMTMNANYPGKHEIKVINVYECRNKVISEIEIKSQMPERNNMHLYAISFFEIQNNKIASAKEYWADTYVLQNGKNNGVSVFSL